jgi:hypothetical protein
LAIIAGSVIIQAKHHQSTLTTRPLQKKLDHIMLCMQFEIQHVN